MDNNTTPPLYFPPDLLNRDSSTFLPESSDSGPAVASCQRMISPFVFLSRPGENGARGVCTFP